MNHLKFRLVSPERILFSGEVQMVVIPGTTGDIGVLVNHAPLVTSLKSGLVKIYGDQGLEKQVFITDGFALISDSLLELIAEEAIFIEELDASKVNAYIEKILEEMNVAKSEEDKERLKNDLKVAKMQRNILSSFNKQNSSKDH